MVHKVATHKCTVVIYRMDHSVSADMSTDGTDSITSTAKVFDC